MCIQGQYVIVLLEVPVCAYMYTHAQAKTYHQWSCMIINLLFNVNAPQYRYFCNLKIAEGALLIIVRTGKLS